MSDDAESRDIFGDDLGSLQQRLSRDLMQTGERLPSMLDRAVEGGEGPVELTAQEWAELQQSWLRIFHTHIQNLAGAIDVTRARLHVLEKRLDEG